MAFFFSYGRIDAALGKKALYDGRQLGLKLSWDVATYPRLRKKNNCGIGKWHRGVAVA